MAKVRLNKRCDAAVCMVVGCGGVAIYRNASSARVNGTTRGYCRKHKQLAVGNHSDANITNGLERYLDYYRERCE